MRFHRFVTVLFYTLLFSGGIWFYQTNQPFQNRVNLTATQAQQAVTNLGRRLTGQKTTHQAAKATHNDINGADSGQWTTNQATIYLDMQNETLETAMKEAILTWNATGCFTFKIVNQKSQANLIATTMDKTDDQAAGLTDMAVNTTTGYFIRGHVYLNTAYLLNPAYGYTHERIVNTAEHELGHAIGLSHTGQISVMQPAGSNYSIQPADVAAVQKLYQPAAKQ